MFRSWDPLSFWVMYSTSVSSHIKLSNKFNVKYICLEGNISVFVFGYTSPQNWCLVPDFITQGLIFFTDEGRPFIVLKTLSYGLE